MSVQFPIPRQIRRQDFVAQAGQTDFAPVAFRAYAAEDVRVLIRRSANEVFLPLLAGYLVQLVGPPPSFVTVQLARPSVAGELVRIEGARLPSRETDVTLAGIIRAAPLEGELDRITVTQQEHRRDLDDLSGQVGQVLAELAQLRALIEAGASAGLPSALDLLSAISASAHGAPGAPALSVPLPPNPVAAIARTISPRMDDPASRIWHHARSGVPSSPFAALVASALGLSSADIEQLALYASANFTEAATSRATPYGLLNALAAVAAGAAGAPSLSVPVPAEPARAIASRVDPRWDSPSRLVWTFARSAEPGSPFSNLVRSSLGLTEADMLALARYS